MLTVTNTGAGRTPDRSTQTPSSTDIFLYIYIIYIIYRYIYRSRVDDRFVAASVVISSIRRLFSFRQLNNEERKIITHQHRAAEFVENCADAPYIIYLHNIEIIISALHDVAALNLIKLPLLPPLYYTHCDFTITQTKREMERERERACIKGMPCCCWNISALMKQMTRCNSR